MEEQRAREEEQRARDQEKQRNRQQDQIERSLTATQNFRGEVERWQTHARLHVADVQSAWRISLLDDDAQKARRNLVLLSGVAGFANLLGIVPHKIAALGIEFQDFQQRNWHAAVFIVLSYSLAGFALKCAHSYSLWKDCIHSAEATIAAFSSGLPEYMRDDPVVITCIGPKRRTALGLVLADIGLPVLLAGAAIVASVVRF